MSGGLHERLEKKRAEEAAARGQALPSEYYPDGTRKPEWQIRAEQNRLPAQVQGGPGDTPSDYRR